MANRETAQPPQIVSSQEMDIWRREFAQNFPAEMGYQIQNAPDLCQLLAGRLQGVVVNRPQAKSRVQEFCRHLAGCIAAEQPSSSEQIGEMLEKIHIDDLFLTHCCLAGDTSALVEFETTYMGEIERRIRRYDSGRDLVAEVSQRLRTKLFVKKDQRQPRLALYSGQGELRSWLNVAATREALDFLRQQKRDTPVEENALEAAVEYADQEILYMKNIYRQEFKKAFRAAFLQLSTRDRTILKYQLLDHFTVDQIAAVYNVNRSTVTRWITSLRSSLLQQTQQALMEMIKVDRREVESIVKLIESQLDVSMHSLLNKM